MSSNGLGVLPPHLPYLTYYSSLRQYKYFSQIFSNDSEISLITVLVPNLLWYYNIHISKIARNKKKQQSLFYQRCTDKVRLSSYYILIRKVYLLFALEMIILFVNFIRIFISPQGTCTNDVHNFGAYVKQCSCFAYIQRN